MIRSVVFLVGLILMAVSLLPVPRWPEHYGDTFLFRLGLLLAVASHGMPEGLR